MSVVTDGERTDYVNFYFGISLFDYWKGKKAKAGSNILESQVELRNLLRQVIDEGVDIIPASLNVTMVPEDLDPAEDPDDAQKKRINAFESWATKFQDRPIFEGRQTMLQSLRLWRILLRLVGDLVFKLPYESVDGKNTVTPVRMRFPNTLVKGDGKTIKGITGWRFTYAVMSDQSYMDTTQSIPVIEEIEIDPTTNKVSWKSTLIDKATGGTVEIYPFDPKFDFLPVVHFAFEEQDDNARGVPFARRLVDSALGYITTKTLIAMSNRYTGNKLLVLTNNDGDLPQLGPGGYLNLKDSQDGQLKATAAFIGGSESLTPLENALHADKKECYEAGFTPYRSDHEQISSGASGKAQIQLSAPQIAFFESYTSKEAAFWADFFYKCARIEGLDIKPGEVQVTVDPIEIPNNDERKLKVDTYLQMGADKQVLMELGHSDEEAQSILDEIALNKKLAGESLLQQSAADDQAIDPISGLPIPADPAAPVPDPNAPKPKPAGK